MAFIINGYKIYILIFLYLFYYSVIEKKNMLNKSNV